MEKAEKYSKIALTEFDEQEDIDEEYKQLSEIYFAQYLAFVAANDWDNAIKSNNSGLQINIKLLGEYDLNVANNYYLGAQIYLKKMQIDKALEYSTKANDIIDSKVTREPLLLTRYRFLRAKLYKIKDDNKKALKDLEDAIRVAENNPQLYNDEVEIKNYRKNLIDCLTDEEAKELNINIDQEEGTCINSFKPEIF